MDILLGWVEPKDRTYEQHDAHQAIMTAMPRYAMPPNPYNGKPPVGTKVLLTDLWQHQKVVAALGSPFTGVRQVSGSCVGAGGGNALFTTATVDIIKNKEAEKIVVPFWLFNYGRSRLLAGMRGEGEGSFGSTFAKSCTQDGVVDTFDAELMLPKPDLSNQFCWGKRTEFTWSDGNEAPSALRQVAKTKLIRTTTPVSSGEAVRDAIMNAYPCTRASGVFCNPGSARVIDGALIGQYDGRGGHQETWLGYWHHPQRGELIYEMNQWGKDAYGKDPGGGADGGCWISLEAVDRMFRSSDAEVFAFSQYEGYPGQPELFDWLNESFFV